MFTRRAGVLSLFLVGASLVALGAAAASAADIKPAIVYDIGGKFDKSFNEGVFHGAEKFKPETGIDFRDFEITNDAQREQALRRFAKDGFSPIIAVGFGQAERAGRRSRPSSPRRKFAIIDSVVDKPNVQSVDVQGGAKARSWSACSPPRRRRPARSASWAAWTSR